MNCTHQDTYMRLVWYNSRFTYVYVWTMCIHITMHVQQTIQIDSTTHGLTVAVV